MKIVSTKSCRAVAALSAVLLIGGIISEVAMASLISSYLVSQEGLGARISKEAYLVSRSGIEDAILRVSREGNDYNVTSYGSYDLSVGVLGTHVGVVKTTPALYSSKFTITSTASVLNKERKIQAVVIVNTITGVSQIESIEDVI